MEDFSIKTYAAYLDAKSDLVRSSSGGAATALSMAMIDSGGCVAGVQYNSNFYSAEYVIVDDYKSLDKLKGTKYIRAEKNGIYDKVKLIIKEKNVLFIGLPCECAAVSKVCGDNHRLVICELVCHGPMVGELHKKFVSELEEKYNSKVVDLNVRYKKRGWIDSWIRVKFESGKVFEAPFRKTVYGEAFGIAGEKSCYAYKFKAENHQADLMIGDFWGANPNDAFWNSDGVSLIVVRTEKGMNLLRQTTKNLKLFISDYEYVTSNNLMIVKSRENSIFRDDYIDCAMKYSLSYAHKYVIPARYKIASFVKRFSPKGITPFLSMIWKHLK